MAYAMTKQGSLDNCITYEFICDTIEDMNAIENRYRSIGSVAIVLQGESEGLEVYIAGSDKNWNSLSSAGANSSTTGGLSIYICGQDEVDELTGLPDIAEPDETSIYLVPAGETSGNLYEEYIYVDEAWEKFGSANIDLSGYAPIDNPNFTGSVSLDRYTNSTVGTLSVALGRQTTASGDYSFAEGNYTTASAPGAHAEGQSTVASANNAHAEGLQTKARGDYSHAEGKWDTGSQTTTYNNTTYYYGASGAASHSEGANTIAHGDASHAEGNSTKAIGYYSHTEGTETTATGRYGAHAEGNGTVAEGDTSHAEGNYTIASGENAHAEGQGTLASARNTHAEGNHTTASGNYSHAEGSGAVANAYYSHAEGLYTIAGGQAAHAEGYGPTGSNQARIINNTSYTIGAMGSYSHAEGMQTLASAQGSHAEGNNTNAIGDFSHAEGLETSATSTSAHSEGYQTEAKMTASHAEGYHTVAEGSYSHAEGSYTIAKGDATHVSGMYNTVMHNITAPQWEANHEYQVGDFVYYYNTLFKCKETHTSGSYLDSMKFNSYPQKTIEVFVVGNGLSQDNRSNALTLDWSGDLHLAKDIYINCNPDSTGGTALGALVSGYESRISALEAEIASLRVALLALMTEDEVTLENGAPLTDENGNLIEYDTPTT